MSEIMIPADQPDASFGTLGSRYYGIYRLPHGRWRQLVDGDKQRLYFGSAQEATRAAMAKVNAILFRPVKVDRVEAEALPAFLDTSNWKAERDERLAIERRTVFPGRGKGSVAVETKRRRVLAR
jgi:hypothetical protein